MCRRAANRRSFTVPAATRRHDQRRRAAHDEHTAERDRPPRHRAARAGKPRLHRCSGSTGVTGSSGCSVFVTVTEIAVPAASTVKDAGVITGDCHVPPAGFAELVSVTVHELPTGTSVAAVASPADAVQG